MTRPLYEKAIWPADQNAVKILVLREADRFGNQRFDTLWWEGEERRARCSNNRLRFAIENWECQGKTIILEGVGQ